jgi:hypothetical protein
MGSSHLALQRSLKVEYRCRSTSSNFNRFRCTAISISFNIRIEAILIVAEADIVRRPVRMVSSEICISIPRLSFFEGSGIEILFRIPKRNHA